MKKVLIGIMAAALLAGAAAADTFTVTQVATGTVTFTSAQLPISGFFEKMEYVKNGAATTTVTLATFDGTTAIDSIAVATAIGATRGVIRTRVVGTGNTGTTLASATNTSGVASTVLTVPYEKPVLGGNMKLTFANTQDLVTTNTVTIFYTPFTR